ncbi:transglycosylase SLT domain-containing protein [Parasedimentitalea psychrophila]|uniref:Lytic transglycosylase n=1 Tax=Parasedimentitalea psychrophila TaxID=2997337 RepID=A0A9Y2L296_9RHOB|nr:lytic transglycosylase [Parasedimentitalea psychrophila]NRB21043.1 lytic transglycosylase [Paracoccaceae bacterium]WIY26998.1 lytic transglycosylase [Parasedimentitalea psychrophila]
MSRIMSALIALLIMASCGGGQKSPPRNLDNACSIISQKSDYLKAFKAAERRWGVPVHVQMATIYQESRYRADARTPHKYVLGIIPMGRVSSAYGFSQALDGTWDEYQREAGRRSSKRNRIGHATDFIGWYMNKTRAKNGIALSDARNQYLAYHEGHTGYARGSYRSKPWLLRVADKVDARADMYQRQLANCRKFN